MSNETIYYRCELGTLRISASESYINEITFTKELLVAEANTIKAPSLPVLKNTVQELDEYFSGDRKDFSFPIRQNGTEFQHKVWNQLRAIPFGKTISYFELSKKLGNTKAIRAAASANGKNSLAIVVPCHRVIGTNGTLVGYAGELWRKQWLLRHEAKYEHGVQCLF